MSNPPRVPRSVLWPPYMSAQAWKDLADSVDTVFSDDPTYGAEVDTVQDALRWLRETYIADTLYNPAPGAYNSPAATAIQNRNMMDPSYFSTFDNTTDTLRVNQLGLKLRDPTVLSEGSLQRLIQGVGAFWYGKGQGSFIDFVAWVLNAPVTMQTLWTQDYINFVPAGDPSIGTPVWQSGTWYPTTHVSLVLTGTILSSDQFSSLIQLFYDIANYNLILYGINEVVYGYQVTHENATTSYPTVPIVPTSGVPCAVVCMASHLDRIDYIYSA